MASYLLESYEAESYDAPSADSLDRAGRLAALSFGRIVEAVEGSPLSFGRKR
jgi:hypothetical protein